MQVDLDTVKQYRAARSHQDRRREATSLENELSGILLWVEQLAEVDTDGVEPMTHRVVPIELKQREDVVTDGDIAEDVIRNAPVAEKRSLRRAQGGRIALGGRHGKARVRRFLSVAVLSRRQIMTKIFVLFAVLLILTGGVIMLIPREGPGRNLAQCRTAGRQPVHTGAGNRRPGQCAALHPFRIGEPLLFAPALSQRARRQRHGKVS